MATNSRVVPVPQHVVWALLEDGEAYAHWVVGTSTVRRVDDTWPQVGSRLHYRLGRGPLRYDGHTEVLSIEPGGRLELEAHAWPAGTARIEITLAARDGGCEVTMVEHPHRGVAALLHNPVGDALLKLRNVEALRRLGQQARASRAAQ